MSFAALAILAPMILGLLVRRWLVIAVPALAWPVYFIGRNREWWGCCGTGEFWEYGAAAVSAVGVLAGAIGVGLGQRFAKRFAGSS